MPTSNPAASRPAPKSPATNTPAVRTPAARTAAKAPVTKAAVTKAPAARATPPPTAQPPEDESRQRDFFAACALQGLLAKGLEVSADRMLSPLERDTLIAERAFQLADVMLIAREAKADQKKTGGN